MIIPQVTLSMDVIKVDQQAFEFFVNPIQSQNLQIWQEYYLSIFKSYVFLQNLEGIAQELNMRLLGYCGRWISHEGPLQGSGTSIIPNSHPPSSLSSRTTLLVPVLVERFPYLQLPAGAEFLNNGTLYPSMKAANKTRQDKVKYYQKDFPHLEYRENLDLDLAALTLTQTIQFTQIRGTIIQVITSLLVVATFKGCS